MCMHNFSQSVHVYDNFFTNPYKIANIGNSLEYFHDETWPGVRTQNLFQSNNNELIEFAKYFTIRIAHDVLYGLNKFEIDIRFHKNDIYNVDEANFGWIHNDSAEIAGLVYLNQEPPSMLTGTSIFDKNNKVNFATDDFESRKQLNVNQVVTDNYLRDLRNNRSLFDETVNMGNKFNRLIAYDAEQWHRPNSYKVDTAPRYSLLFFIKHANFTELQPLLNINSDWRDE